MDRDFNRCDRDENYVPPEASTSQTCTGQSPPRDESAYINGFRDQIIIGLLNRS